jgi:hypothetical protein
MRELACDRRTALPMKPRLHLFILVVALALRQASAVMAQEAHFTHGAAEGGQVRTNRSLAQFPKSSVHEQLESSALTVQLRPGDSDLFVFEFNAECWVFHPMEDDPIDHLVGIFGFSFLQPQDSSPTLAACSGGQARHTISKNWVIRLSNTTTSPQTYTFSIWVRTVDLSSLVPNEPFTYLNDRIVRLTRYN